MATTREETWTCETCGRTVTAKVTYLADGTVLEDLHACPHGKTCGRIGETLACLECARAETARAVRKGKR